MVQTQVFIHVRALTPMNTHTYILFYMSTSERLNRLNLEIYEVGHQERLINTTFMLNLEFESR
jgi:hypothetical protein